MSSSASQYRVKVVNQNGSLVAAPASVPTITTSFNDLSRYSNTQQMLANDATTYANAIAYTSNAVANITISAISDVTLSTIPPANNSTLVYSSANNKYVVKQLDLDGGSF
jgi:hypothetical protein